jgi:acyl carrier protein
MKQSFISDQKVLEEFKKAIVEALGVDGNSIQPESSLIKDLGAESLDFLDINYKLEQVFGIKMARHFILEHTEEMFGEGSTINDETQLTENAIKLLKIRFGDDLPDLKAGVDLNEVPNLITVQTMVSGVMELLNTLPEKCSSCGNAAWKPEDGNRIKCGSCEEYATFTNGDDLIKEWLSHVQKEHKIF